MQTGLFIKLFKVALKSNVKSETPMDPIKVNEMALKCGYIVHPDCCTKSTYEYFAVQGAWNPNSTFYKTWEDVTSKSRFELFIDQCIHYASTYGTDFSVTPYVLNDGAEVDYNTYTVIQPIDEKGLYDKCLDLVCSGIALQSDLVKKVCHYIIEYNGFGLNVDSIKNREAQIYIAYNTHMYPSNPEDFFKCLVYQATGETMVIKNKEMINKIKVGDFVCFDDLTDDELIILSKVFNRYKPLFLAFKHQLDWQYSNANAINKIRKYAKRYHSPKKIGFWESVLSVPHSENKIKDEAAKLDNNYKIVKLLQAIRERLLLMKDGGKSLYIIRNGKSYLKNMCNKEYDKCLIEQLGVTYDILYDRLVNNLSSKACVVKFPKYLNLACPVSEKQFIGNIPYGSSYKMKEHNFIGIYWRNEWGAYDFDLSLMNYSGKIGWNVDYCFETDVIYSGDMTNADPEATEIMYCKKECPNSLIYVNRFNGLTGSKFKLFFGSQEIKKLSRNYMVDPNCIELDEMIESKYGREQLIGYIKDNCVYFMDLTTGNSRVSCDEEYLEVLNRKIQTYIDLKGILMKAGFVEYDEKIHKQCDLDLTNLDKSTLINLFA